MPRHRIRHDLLFADGLLYFIYSQCIHENTPSLVKYFLLSSDKVRNIVILAKNLAPRANFLVVNPAY